MILVGILLRLGSITAWVVHIVACMGGCLGCNSRPKLISSFDRPLKGRKPQALHVPNHSISEELWTTSARDMDNSAAQSRGSISSISTSTQTLDAHNYSSSASIPSEFVNRGLLSWNQTRQQWLGNKKSVKQAHQLREPKLSWKATYDSLLGSNKPFPKPIPLSEMIDFLVDVWEQDGLYD